MVAVNDNDGRDDDADADADDKRDESCFFPFIES